jgi:hypothetical protein
MLDAKVCKKAVGSALRLSMQRACKTSSASVFDPSNVSNGQEQLQHHPSIEKLSATQNWSGISTRNHALQNSPSVVCDLANCLIHEYEY